MRVKKLILVMGLVAMAACSLDKQPAPDLTGPSGMSTVIEVKATPDLLVRDGASQSTIEVTVTNASGQPIPNQSLHFATQVNLGSVSQTTATTNAAGKAAVTYTAPGAGNSITTTLTVTPIGTNNQNTLGRTVAIRLVSQ